jgi:hypothetical protein
VESDVYKDMVNSVEELQNKIESFDINNKEILKMIDTLCQNLNTNKISQVTIRRRLLNLKDDLNEELEDETSQDLRIGQLAERFVEDSDHYEILRINEYNLMKKFIVQLLDIYEDYERAIEKRNINVEKITNVNRWRGKKVVKPIEVMDDREFVQFVAKNIDTYNIIKEKKHEEDRRKLTSAHFIATKKQALRKIKERVRNELKDKPYRHEMYKLFKKQTGDSLWRKSNRS